MTPVITALTKSTGGNRHILTLGNGWSTAINRNDDGTFDIEHRAVINELRRAVKEGDETSVILRTFTSDISHTLPNGTRIPIKEVRGWYLNEGHFHPLSEKQMFSASCTDAETGEPIPPPSAPSAMSTPT